MDSIATAKTAGLGKKNSEVSLWSSRLGVKRNGLVTHLLRKDIILYIILIEPIRLCLGNRRESPLKAQTVCFTKTMKAIKSFNQKYHAVYQCVITATKMHVSDTLAGKLMSQYTHAARY